MEPIRAAWRYRGFILGTVKREFQLRYRNSLLGATWAILSPMSMIFVYTIIFSKIMQTRLPGADSSFGYSIYLCAGVFTWGLFSEIVTRSQNVFIENANLLKKINFPRGCLPATVIASALINYSVVLALFTLLLISSGNFPGLPYIALPLVIGTLVIFAAGLGMLLSILNVFFRDVGQLFGIFLTFWFWSTPIVYTTSILPREAQILTALNPITSIVVATQDIFVRAAWPQWGSLVYPALSGILLCALGAHAFRVRSSEIMDEL